MENKNKALHLMIDNDITQSSTDILSLCSVLCEVKSFTI